MCFVTKLFATCVFEMRQSLQKKMFFFPKLIQASPHTSANMFMKPLFFCKWNSEKKNMFRKQPLKKKLFFQNAGKASNQKFIYVFWKICPPKKKLVDKKLFFPPALKKNKPKKRADVCSKIWIYFCSSH